MREVILHSFFQCLQSFVKALDMPALISELPENKCLFCLRNFCIDCATNSLFLSICKYTDARSSLLRFSLIRVEKLLSRSHLFCHVICLPHIVNVCYVVMQSSKFSA